MVFFPILWVPHAVTAPRAVGMQFAISLPPSGSVQRSCGKGFCSRGFLMGFPRAFQLWLHRLLPVSPRLVARAALSTVGLVPLSLAAQSSRVLTELSPPSVYHTGTASEPQPPSVTLMEMLGNHLLLERAKSDGSRRVELHSFNPLDELVRDQVSLIDGLPRVSQDSQKNPILFFENIDEGDGYPGNFRVLLHRATSRRAATNFFRSPGYSPLIEGGYTVTPFGSEMALVTLNRPYSRRLGRSQPLTTSRVYRTSTSGSSAAQLLASSKLPVITAAASPQGDIAMTLSLMTRRLPQPRCPFPRVWRF